MLLVKGISIALSESRCLTKYPKFVKNSKCRFYIIVWFFKIAQKVAIHIWILSTEILMPITFKDCPIWSHLLLCTILHSTVIEVLISNKNCLLPMAEVPSNYLSCCSGHFINLLYYMKSKHFLAKFIKLKLLVRSLGHAYANSTMYPQPPGVRGPKMGISIFMKTL